jgi:hypothetical protein
MIALKSGDSTEILIIFLFGKNMNVFGEVNGLLKIV